MARLTLANLRHGWKILTHDWCSPLQGGPPLVNNSLPVTLPTVRLDTGPEECAAGWHYVADIPTGWQIVGMWPAGWPVRIVQVEAGPDAIERRSKRRASSLTLVREATSQEVWSALMKFSEPFGRHATRMAEAQAAWQRALGRPHHDPAKVKAQLALALSARNLLWSLIHFRDARDIQATKDTWNTKIAQAKWNADVWRNDDANDQVVTRIWDAGDPWVAWDARSARYPSVSWEARGAWDAWGALLTMYARLRGQQHGEPDQYTVGIQEAYTYGLAIAFPVGLDRLGWAMVEPSLSIGIGSGRE